jgi:alanyl-tRNA synthetase
MSTNRLYYADSYLCQFSAQIVARDEQQGQQRIALDQSAFYPESGGQPADRGTINGIAVLDVQVEDGIVWHSMAEPINSDQVQGQIDWERRFDHMQQHHGQHLLSAAFEQLYSMRTVSFHLGVDYCTIDIDVPALHAKQAAEIEDLTNRIIWEDRPVTARFVSDEELKSIPLRKAPSVSGAIRVVSVPDFDYSACGGTHPRSTGSVGLVHIRRWERRADTIRVEFVCGQRAAHDLRWKNASLARIASELSVGSDEAEAALARLREREEIHRKHAEALNEQLLAYEAAALQAKAQSSKGYQLIIESWTDRPLEDIRTLARLTAQGQHLVVFGLRAEKTQVIVASGENVSEADCGAIIRQILTPLGGRGGGQRHLAQGGLPSADLLDTALQQAQTLLA